MAYETSPHNGEKSTSEIQRDLDRTRAELSSTLDALETRLNPSELVDTSIDYLRSGPAADYVRNLGWTASENPMPITLVGVGLAWLMMSGRHTGESTGRMRGALSEKAHAISESAQSIAGQAKVGSAKASGRMRAAGERVSAKSSEVYGQARDMSRGASRGVSDMVHDNPLLVGLATMGIGALFGAMFPPTRAEDETLGPSRDAAMERAQHMAQEATEKGEQAARAAAETAKHEMSKEQQGKDVGESTGDIVRSAAEAARGQEKPKGGKRPGA